MSSNCAMFYHSLEFLRFISSFIEARPLVILCREESRLVGALPVFIKRNAKFGAVLNSLPFFGSHGGALVMEDLAESAARQVRESLIQHLTKEVWRAEDISFATIITSPYEKDLRAYENAGPRYIERRLTQMVTMPQEATESEIARTFEKRCRWAIKVATEEHVLVRVMDSFEKVAIDEIYGMHLENAAKIGAVPKPWAFFEHLTSFFVIHRDFDIYLAEHAGRLIAALLVFYFKGFVEYYMPVVKPEYRSLNPTNLLILKAMTKAVSRRLTIWNFGGTGKAMKGVYLFKRSFGSGDYEYHCLTYGLSDSNSELLHLTPQELRNAYEWFYVIPYAALSSNTEEIAEGHA